MLLYFIHERIWFKLNLLRAKTSKIRHITKSISWRFVGSIDTILLTWIISGNLKFGMEIGSFELFTKMILYYIHERIWYKSKFGLV
jgi:uncharacterized membrane protein